MGWIMSKLSDNVVQQQGKVRIDILQDPDQTGMAWTHCLRKLHAPKKFGLGPPRTAVGLIFYFSAKIWKKSTIYIFGSLEFIFKARTIIFDYVVSKMIVFHQKKRNYK